MSIDMVANGEPRAWREGYRRYLQAKGVPTQQAGDLAARVAFRADLYPALPLFDDALLPPAEDSKTQLRVRRTAADRLVKTGAEIASEPPSGNDLVFMHSVLCHVGLPRSRFEGREFFRQSGAAWLLVKAGSLSIPGTNKPVEQSIPYGAVPRFVLAWISTYAKRHGTREIPIGQTPGEFLRLMNMGMQSSSYVALRKQIHALAACHLQLGYNGRTYNGQPVEQFDAWVTGRMDTSQRSLWPGVMLLAPRSLSA